jgi:hypothetical protein
VTDRFCSACGAPVELDARSCPHCRHPLGGTAAAEPVATSPPPPGAGASVPATESRGTFGRHKARNLLLFAVATVVVIGLAIGIALALTFSSSESGQLVLESATSTGADPGTDSTANSIGSTATPTATGSECGSSAKSLTPRTPAEEVLVNYFNAINIRDYARAWGYLDSRVQARYKSENAFAAMMSEHVACVRVLDINLATNRDDPDTPPDIAVSASLGIQWYRVQFADQYVTPFPAGSGSLPPFWKVEANTDEGAPPPKILDSATGP